MSEFRGLRTSDLMRSLERLEEQVSKAPPEERDAEDLRLHQAELELQNRQLRESQEALELSRDQYANLYDLSPVGYLTLSSKGKILQCNLTAASLISRPRARVAGTFLDSYLGGPVQVKRFSKHLRDAKEGPAGFSGEFSIALPDGGSRPVLVETISVDHEPESPSFRCAMSDISERRRREEELEAERAARTRLEEQNRRLLHETLESRERRDRALSRDIHNELGQPVAALVLRALLISKTSRDPEVIQAAEQMVALCDTMADQVRGLCQTLRPPALNGTDPLDALRQLVSDWDAASSNTSVEFTIDDAMPAWPENLTVVAHRILQEALTNVRRHSSATTVTIDIRSLSGEAGDTAEIVVVDDGVGIRGDAMDQGLGLIAMRERVLLRGGEFRVVSREGEGATIIVRLPIPAVTATVEIETPTV